MPVKQLRLLKVFYLFLMLSLSHLLIAGETHPHDIEAAKQFINEALKVNKSYISKNGQAFFKKLSKGQQPRATIVGCADSRAQTNKLSDSPEGDIFMIRNIGNQVEIASTEFNNKLSNDEILIVGAVYDFANDMKQGPGKLNIININGKTNPVEIKQILSNL
jgi:DNA polymerase III delta prime subunit